ncbi:MAG: thermonuclease family protein, partial [Desulfovibrionales bacterium]|nr:thermonuclease family protein [Desulfovibrionales bacterium]
MKRLSIFCFIFFLFFIAASSIYARQAKVVWVPDGDTLVLEGREFVRLKGIDAPETGDEGEMDQYFASESTLRLEELTKGRSVNLKIGQEPEDRFGRTLAYVYLPTGENLNILMVREGLAFYYPHGVQ